MSAVDHRFRRNFVLASILHVALIGSVILWEQFFANGSASAKPTTEMYIPADILGDLPKGEGSGRGAYKAPPAGAEVPAGPSEAMSSADETAAAQPKPASNEIAIPKKTTAKKPPAKIEKATTTKPKATSVAKPTSKSKPTAVASGPSADDFRKRFASALASAENGTAGGDNKPAGGGSGKSGRIGSPNGSPNGIPGGIGQGSPFWDYYQHVHDQMYQAWEQPGDGISKKLVAVVMIHVARDGTITDVEIRNSSGNKLMDDSAVAAARKVQRLDPPPDALVKGITADIAVNFSVEG